MIELSTPTEMAEMLRVPVSWLYARTRQKGTNKIPMIRIGKYMRFEKDKVLEWIQKGDAHGLIE